MLSVNMYDDLIKYFLDLWICEFIVVKKLVLIRSDDVMIVIFN